MAKTDFITAIQDLRSKMEAVEAARAATRIVSVAYLARTVTYQTWNASDEEVSHASRIVAQAQDHAALMFPRLPASAQAEVLAGAEGQNSWKRNRSDT